MLKDLDLYTKISYIAILVGGILWGLAGITNIYLADIFGNFLGRLLYIAIGAAAGWLCYQMYLEMYPPRPVDKK